MLKPRAPLLRARDASPTSFLSHKLLQVAFDLQVELPIKKKQSNRDIDKPYPESSKRWVKRAPGRGGRFTLIILDLRQTKGGQRLGTLGQTCPVVRKIRCHKNPGQKKGGRGPWWVRTNVYENTIMKPITLYIPKLSFPSKTFLKMKCNYTF